MITLSPLKRFIAGFCLCSSISLLGQAAPSDLPDVGSSATQALSLSEENVIGSWLMNQVRAQDVLITDPQLNDYLTNLGDRLVKHSPEPSRDFHFFLIRDLTLNAFAWPGAWIGTYAGLILLTQKESELAAVLAHEIAHVCQRHHARAFEKAKQMSLPTLAALIGAMAVTIAAPGIGNAALASVMAGSQQASIDFTRHNEQEADRIGIDILARSHFDPNSMSDFFARMQNSMRYSDSGGFEYLRSHPLSESRMADAQNRAGKYKRTPIETSADYAFMRERLAVLVLNRTQLKTIFAKADLSQKPIRYAKSLFEWLIHDYKSAEQTLAPLLTDSSLPPTVAFLQAQILTDQGNTQAGIALAEKVVAQNPKRRGLFLSLCDLYLAHGQAEKAKTLLRQAVLADPTNPEYHERLAKAYEQLGQPKLAYLSSADALIAQCSYERALFELKHAQNMKPHSTYYDALITASIQKTETAFARQKQMQKNLGIKED